MSKGPYKPVPKHIDLLPLKERERLLRIEQVILRCLRLKYECGGRLPKGECKAAMGELRIKSRQTLLNLMEYYTQHQRLHPDEPAVNAFIKGSGRPSKCLLTPEQEMVALGAFLYTDWETILPTGKINRSKMKVSIDFVHSVLMLTYPDLQLRTHDLWRFLTKQQHQKKALFDLARKGEKAVWEKLLPKQPNDVSEPDQRWQSDGRPLAIYVHLRLGEGKSIQEVRCTVTLIIIIDDFSRYVLGWAIVPRLEEDDSGGTRRTDFKGADICTLFAHSMYRTQRRPLKIYTDNGSQYQLFEPKLRYLTVGDETPIEMIFSKPGHPWGRGKVEVIGKLIDDFLRKIAGFVENERDLQSVQRAKNAPDILTFEELEENLKAYFEQWNNTSKDSQPSRYEIWKNTPHTLLPAPSPLRLAHLAHGADWKMVSVTDDGLRYKGILYTPMIKSKEDRIRWASAVGQSVPLCFIPLTNSQYLAIACIDGKDWEQVEPIRGRPLSAKKHAEYQNAVIKHLKGELRALQEAATRILIEHHGTLPQVDALTDTALIPNPKKGSASTVDAQASPDTLEASATGEAAELGATGDGNSLDQRSPEAKQNTSVLNEEHKEHQLPLLNADASAATKNDSSTEPNEARGESDVNERIRRLREARRNHQ